MLVQRSRKDDEEPISSHGLIVGSTLWYAWHGNLLSTCIDLVASEENPAKGRQKSKNGTQVSSLVTWLSSHYLLVNAGESGEIKAGCMMNLLYCH